MLLGQSDAGAHVANANPGFGFATTMLAYWVRERQIMSLEDAIKKLTFLPASIFGIRDRGLLRQGMAADIFVFDPDEDRSSRTGKSAGSPRRRAALHSTRQRNPLHDRQRFRPDEKRRPYGCVSGESAAKRIKKF